MTFLWPENLWMLPALLVLPPLYLWLLRRGRPTLRYSSLAAVRVAAGNRWRRHLPPALVLAALALLTLAAARPAAKVPLPWTRPTILLAIDVSLSMRVTDVKPTRMVAAQEAAKTFLLDLPRHVDVGLVTFAGNATVAQRATPDREALTRVIDAFQMQIGTAVGNAIVLCMAELFPHQGIQLDQLSSRVGQDPLRAADRPAVASKPVAPGSYESAAIILLSDGRRTTGVDTLEAARLAADRGVRIYVVGLGTVDGAAHGDDGMAIYMRLDEPTLREVARMTGGEYHHAGTAEDLRNVYRRLGSRLEVQTRDTELTAALSLAGAVLVGIGAGLSMLWFGRLG